MKKHINKLAKLAYSGASMKAMAAVFNVDEEQISQLIKTDDYKTEMAIITEESFTKAAILDKGWEGIEEYAVSSVLDVLMNAPDPDFALKAAGMANKAIRRNGMNGMGNKQNNMIQINQNMQAIIHVQPVFAKTLQEHYLVEDVRERELPKKVVNAMNPKMVKELLTDGENHGLVLDEIGAINPEAFL